MIRWWLRQRPVTVLAAASALIAIIAICDWRITFNATLGFLYIFPLAMLGTIFRTWQLLGAAICCMMLSNWLDPFSMDLQIPRSILIFVTLATTGLLSRELAVGYRSEMESLTRLKQEAQARQNEIAVRLAAEEQLDFLVQNSPAAVLTMTALGEILLANPAAHLLLDVPSGGLLGKRITRYIPALGSVPSVDQTSNIFKTEMQTTGQREQGDVFLANVFFSTYRTAAGPRLSALIIDASEQLREREESGLQQLLASSRILVAAVSHEVRNVCGAIGVLYENLSRGGKLTGDQDFKALGSLIETLSKIASLELKRTTENSTLANFSIHEVLTDLRIVLEPSCEESDIELHWETAGDVPLIRADRQLLMQILLNLTKNSQRALKNCDTKRISITAEKTVSGVAIFVTDSGPGIPPGYELFRPLQKDADATGLGLYLSRAFARSFRGEIRHNPTASGCRFVVELPIAPTS
jgi:two-component system, LuxR family, sensor kinase FixL